ncbi:hypothetical protein B566_EDAN002732 [Ephemera danica]|nr:hypothetical protein B566_EDAN002732 [Ephemera danica]
MSTGQRITPQLVQVLECMLLKESSQFETSGMSTQDLATTLVNCCVYKTSGDVQKSPLFCLLCDLSLCEMQKNKSNPNVQRSIYSKFLEELPSILIKPVVSAKGLKTICQLAAAQNTSLLQSVKLYLPHIVANLHELNMEGEDKRTVQTAVLGVLYQASVWRVDILDVAAHSLMIHSHHLEHLLCQFKQLMQLKLEREPLCLVSQKLMSMPWFYQES